MRDEDNDDVIYLRPPPGVEETQAEMEARGLKPDPRYTTRDKDGNLLLWWCKGNLYGLQSAGLVQTR